jgi:hypothetical protein
MKPETIAVLLWALSACSRSPSEPPSGSPAAATSVSTAASAVPLAPAPDPHEPRAANLAIKWDDPPRWQKRKPANSMRAAEYAIPRAAGDPEDGECVIITFGPGQGGGVDQNIDRWVAQFAGATDTKRTSREANGTKITRVETTGTYTPMMMPGQASAGPTTRPGWHLVGAIVEAPSGLWFFKLTGPKATITAATAEFDAMLSSVRPS